MAQRCNLLVSFIVFQEASVKRSFTAGCKYLAKREIEEVSQLGVIKRGNNDHCPKRDKDWPQCRSLLSVSSIFPRTSHEVRQQRRRVLERDSSFAAAPTKTFHFTRFSPPLHQVFQVSKLLLPVFARFRNVYFKNEGVKLN